MKVFISGAMSGYVDYNFAAFYKVEEELKAQGYEVVNPARLFAELSSIPSWEDCMKITLKALLDCDAICILKGWNTSKGATIEYNLACSLGYKLLMDG